MLWHERLKKFGISFGAVCALLFYLGRAEAAATPPQKILSLSPASTEILFDLGLGDRVIGVTKYCTWPPEARRLPRIENMMEINMEVVASSGVDLVVLSNMNEHLKPRIEAFGFSVEVVQQDDFDQICDSMIQVGRRCGVEARARERVAELRAEVEELRARARSGKDSPRVLIVVGRDPSDITFKKIYVAGMKSFYNDLLGESNAKNAMEQDVQYAYISREGLLRLNPDIVLDLIGDHGGTDVDSETIRKSWLALTDLPAAASGRIALIRGDFTLRAGPRYPKVLDAFIRVIHGGARVIVE